MPTPQVALNASTWQKPGQTDPSKRPARLRSVTPCLRHEPLVKRTLLTIYTKQSRVCLWHTRLYIYKYTHTLTETYTHTCPYKHAHMHTHLPLHTPLHKHTLAHSHTCAFTFAHTHARAYTHLQAHTYHAYPLQQFHNIPHPSHTHTCADVDTHVPIATVSQHPTPLTHAHMCRRRHARVSRTICILLTSSTRVTSPLDILARLALTSLSWSTTRG